MLKTCLIAAALVLGAPAAADPVQQPDAVEAALGPTDRLYARIVYTGAYIYGLEGSDLDNWSAAELQALREINSRIDLGIYRREDFASLLHVHFPQRDILLSFQVVNELLEILRKETH